MTLREFILRYPIASNKAEVERQIQRLPHPSTLGGKIIPDTLNEASMGEIMSLKRAMNINGTDIDKIKSSAMVMGIVVDESEESAEAFFGFGFWIARELERIAKLFNSTRIEPTEEEKQAGVERVNHGDFGLIDWFARRMGITDHEEAERVPWVRYYMCLKIDADNARYERELRKVYSNKHKR